MVAFGSFVLAFGSFVRAFGFFLLPLVFGFFVA